MPASGRADAWNAPRQAKRAHPYAPPPLAREKGARSLAHHLRDSSAVALDLGNVIGVNRAGVEDHNQDDSGESGFHGIDTAVIVGWEPTIF